jgi:hypothetical protein
MKIFLLTGFTVALLLGATALYSQAPADEHAGHHPSIPAPSADSPAAAPSGQAMDAAAMPRMQANMKSMQELMARIRSTKSPAERQQLLRTHSRAMHDQMGMMRGMSGAQTGTMKGQGMMNHDMMDHQAMQSRMDMMQMLMDQMLQHQEARQDAESP